MGQHGDIEWPKPAFSWARAKRPAIHIFEAPVESSSSSSSSSFNIPQLTSLPAFDRALSTRRLCVLAVGVAWLLAILCIAGSIKTSRVDPNWVVPISLSPASHLVLALLFNVVATVITDCLGYIFTTSLRWTLWRESRLAFNSNLRLFISSKTSWLNGRCINGVFALCLVISYTAASQILITVQNAQRNAHTPASDPVNINGVALCAFGLAVLLLALIATLCIVSQSAHILTWSSNPLTTTLACLHDDLKRREGRSMMSADMTQKDAEPMQPKTTQPPMRAADPSVRHVTRLVWSLGPLAFIWASAVLGAAIKYQLSNSWVGWPLDGYLPTAPSLFSTNIFFSIPYNTVPGVSQTVFLVLVGSLQMIVTMIVHCIEVLANRSRDETIWRRAATSPSSYSSISIPRPAGAQVACSPLKTALTSWQTMTLFVSKPLIHWLFGLSIVNQTFGMNSTEGPHDVAQQISVSLLYLPVYLLSIVVALLAVFATFLARRKPRGPLPSAWGHLQTLADLVDDWGANDNDNAAADVDADTDNAWVLFWGDKGYAAQGGCVRRAGTSTRSQEVGCIQSDQLYG